MVDQRGSFAALGIVGLDGFAVVIKEPGTGKGDIECAAGQAGKIL